MNKQELLNHFIKLRNGKGQAIHNKTKTCSYHTKDNSGCAIGCQPNFHEQFPHLKESSEPIDLLIKLDKQLELFFKIESEEDVTFLRKLQSLHDDQNNWNGKDLTLSSIKQFCNLFNLLIPNNNYYDSENAPPEIIQHKREKLHNTKNT